MLMSASVLYAPSPFEGTNAAGGAAAGAHHEHSPGRLLAKVVHGVVKRDGSAAGVLENMDLMALFGAGAGALWLFAKVLIVVIAFFHLTFAMSMVGRGTSSSTGKVDKSKKKLATFSTNEKVKNAGVTSTAAVTSLQVSKLAGLTGGKQLPPLRETSLQAGLLFNPDSRMVVSSFIKFVGAHVARVTPFFEGIVYYTDKSIRSRGVWHANVAHAAREVVDAEVCVRGVTSHRRVVLALDMVRHADLAFAVGCMSKGEVGRVYLTAALALRLATTSPAFYGDSEVAASSPSPSWVSVSVNPVADHLFRLGVLNVRDAEGKDVDGNGLAWLADRVRDDGAAGEIVKKFEEGGWRRVVGRMLGADATSSKSTRTSLSQTIGSNNSNTIGSLCEVFKASMVSSVLAEEIVGGSPAGLYAGVNDCVNGLSEKRARLTMLVRDAEQAGEFQGAWVAAAGALMASWGVEGDKQQQQVSAACAAAWLELVRREAIVETVASASTSGNVEGAMSAEAFSKKVATLALFAGVMARAGSEAGKEAARKTLAVLDRLLAVRAARRRVAFGNVKVMEPRVEVEAEELGVSGNGNNEEADVGSAGGSNPAAASSHDASERAIKARVLAGIEFAALSWALDAAVRVCRVSIKKPVVRSKAARVVEECGGFGSGVARGVHVGFGCRREKRGAVRAVARMRRLLPVVGGEGVSEASLECVRGWMGMTV
ncbi:hypothetical protein HDU76_013433 [Blyttiomyces sp. JEL0837]|nr:hypothetical protein HDU76_013433 [Blyttiomyces sp. JEL0837]